MYGPLRGGGLWGRIIERSEQWSCPGNRKIEGGVETVSVQLPCVLLLLCHNTVCAGRRVGGVVAGLGNWL